MSLREEDRQNKNCPSRGLGLGLAAAAIGVGVGAALYYFVSKRPENPNAAGSTQDWTCDPDHTLDPEESQIADSSFVTVSQHSTTDTSMNDSPSESNSSESENVDSVTDISLSENSFDFSSDFSLSSQSSINNDSLSDDSLTGFDVNDWDITNSIDYPSHIAQTSFYLLGSMNLLKSIKSRDDTNIRRDQAFRERSWSLEECSICFDVILRDQEVMSLPCTHHFHTKCILPWLQEQQTCPNCRKAVD